MHNHTIFKAMHKVQTDKENADNDITANNAYFQMTGSEKANPEPTKQTDVAFNLYSNFTLTLSPPAVKTQ
jgi:hypothetical protein